MDKNSKKTFNKISDIILLISLNIFFLISVYRTTEFKISTLIKYIITLIILNILFIFFFRKYK
ncbi:presenilin-like A22 family membrane protease [Eubacterium multiforme]|uniref:Presenilin-like A22 family membrane protease n=1 Tax=Eubacterium multiforme TaxID=83339 RepID=A0ABT9UTE9_9FIRM|nr:presenilin-like A22 family membrane protease [Eubacterium multiforme]